MARMAIEVRQCSKGHFYSSEYEKCPFCFGDFERENRNSGQENSEDQDATVRAEPTKATVLVNKNAPQVDDYEETAPLYPEMDMVGHDPVVGWLVSIRGPHRGQAFRLHSGANFIGRGKNLDVCIENDVHISTKANAAISYDGRNNVFFLEHCEGRNNIYLNGAILRRPEDLARFDRIIIGASEFIFIPLCGPQFDWNREAERNKTAGERSAE